MYISKQKKDENVAEYILYMWQIEDLIRSCGFNIELIEQSVIDKFIIPGESKMKVRQWYEKLVKTMISENVTDKGHLEELNYIIYELTFLHNSLINIFQDKKYIDLHNEALPNIHALQKQSGGVPKNDVETCLVGLYGLFLLQIQKKPVGPETTKAMKTFSRLLAYLSKKYNELKTGDLQLPAAIRN